MKKEFIMISRQKKGVGFAIFGKQLFILFMVCR
jgi:hypothetical protein